MADQSMSHRDKAEYFPSRYKDPPTPQQLERKQMLQDIEMLTARVLLMTNPSSNVYTDATRIRKRYGMCEVKR